eukprot:Nk52_evm20s1705 gene=Nk52_evmTU20s1705
MSQSPNNEGGAKEKPGLLPPNSPRDRPKLSFGPAANTDTAQALFSGGHSSTPSSGGESGGGGQEKEGKGKEKEGKGKEKEGNGSPGEGRSEGLGGCFTQSEPSLSTMDIGGRKKQFVAKCKRTKPNRFFVNDERGSVMPATEDDTPLNQNKPPLPSAGGILSDTDATATITRLGNQPTPAFPPPRPPQQDMSVDIPVVTLTPAKNPPPREGTGKGGDEMEMENECNDKFEFIPGEGVGAKSFPVLKNPAFHKISVVDDLNQGTYYSKNSTTFNEGDTLYGTTGAKLGKEIRHKMQKYKVVMKQSQTFKYVIHPGNLYKTIWDWFMMVLVLLTCVLVPYAIAFDSRLVPIYVEVIIDVCFISDLVMNFRTGYLDDSGRPIMDPKLIRKHYLRGWFVLDLLAAFPFSLLLLVNGQHVTQYTALAKTPRILRLRELVSNFGYWTNAAGLRILYLFCFWLLLAHWCACFWYLLGVEEDSSDSWVNQYAKKHGTDGVPNAYVTSLYFAVTTLSTVGFGDITAETVEERIYVITMMFLGALMYAFIFGNVTSIVQSFDLRTKEKNKRLEQINRLIKTFDIPYAMQYRIWAYVDHSTVGSDNYDLRATFRGLPDHLQEEVALYIHEPELERLFPFGGKDFLKSVAYKLRWDFCAPKDYLTREGEVGDSLIILYEGAAEILSKGEQVDVLGQGEFFGEEMLEGPGTCYKYSLRALSFCDFFVLYRKDLASVLEFFPAVRAFMVNTSRKGSHQSESVSMASSAPHHHDPDSFFLRPVKENAFEPSRVRRRNVKPDNFGYFEARKSDVSLDDDLKEIRRRIKRTLSPDRRLSDTSDHGGLAAMDKDALPADEKHIISLVDKMKRLEAENRSLRNSVTQATILLESPMDKTYEKPPRRQSYDQIAAADPTYCPSGQRKKSHKDVRQIFPATSAPVSPCTSSPQPGTSSAQPGTSSPQPSTSPSRRRMSDSARHDGIERANKFGSDPGGVNRRFS